MSTWNHPTGRAPKTVVVMSLGPSMHDLIQHTIQHEPKRPIVEADEWWTLNGGVNLCAGRTDFDVLFVMDHLDGEAAREPKYITNILEWQERHQRPIITSVAGAFADDDIHEYPIQEVLDFVGRDNAYFHNSIPYIIAYALFIGVERLLLWGADYETEDGKVREEDRPNAEFWVGFAIGRGMRVTLPAATSLCNVNSKADWFYGYPDDQQPAV